MRQRCLPLALACAPAAHAAEDECPLPANVSVAELAEALREGTVRAVVDVRTRSEYLGVGVDTQRDGIGRVPGAVLVDSLATDPAQEARLRTCKSSDSGDAERPRKTLAVICRTGVRSLVATKQLQAKGYPCVANVMGACRTACGGASVSARGRDANPSADSLVRACHRRHARVGGGRLRRRTGPARGRAAAGGRACVRRRIRRGGSPDSQRRALGSRRRHCELERPCARATFRVLCRARRARGALAGHVRRDRNVINCRVQMNDMRTQWVAHERIDARVRA